MKIFPPLNPVEHKIISEKSAKDVYLSLKMETSDINEFFSEAPFYGSVSEECFSIFPQMKGHSSMKPKIEGNIFENEGKATVIFKVFCPFAPLYYIFGAFGLYNLFLSIPLLLQKNFSGAADSIFTGLVIMLAIQIIIQISYFSPIKKAIKKITDLVT